VLQVSTSSDRPCREATSGPSARRSRALRAPPARSEASTGGRTAPEPSRGSNTTRGQEATTHGPRGPCRTPPFGRLSEPATRPKARYRPRKRGRLPSSGYEGSQVDGGAGRRMLRRATHVGERMSRVSAIHAPASLQSATSARLPLSKPARPVTERDPGLLADVLENDPPAAAR
jgi:hypothetical protein